MAAPAPTVPTVLQLVAAVRPRGDSYLNETATRAQLLAEAFTTCPAEKLPNEDLGVLLCSHVVPTLEVDGTFNFDAAVGTLHTMMVPSNYYYEARRLPLAFTTTSGMMMRLDMFDEDSAERAMLDRLWTARTARDWAVRDVDRAAAEKEATAKAAREPFALDRKVQLAMEAPTAHLRAWAGTMHVQEALGKELARAVCSCCSGTRLEERPPGARVLGTTTSVHMQLAPGLELTVRDTMLHLTRARDFICMSLKIDVDADTVTVTLPSEFHANDTVVVLKRNADGKLVRMKYACFSALAEAPADKADSKGDATMRLLDKTVEDASVEHAAALERVHDLGRALYDAFTPLLRGVDLAHITVDRTEVSRARVDAFVAQLEAITSSGTLPDEAGKEDGGEAGEAGAMGGAGSERPRVNVVDISGPMAASMEAANPHIKGLDAVPDRPLPPLADIKAYLQPAMTACPVLADAVAFVCTLTSPAALLRDVPDFRMTENAVRAIVAGRSGRPCFIKMGRRLDFWCDDTNVKYYVDDTTPLPHGTIILTEADTFLPP